MVSDHRYEAISPLVIGITFLIRQLFNDCTILVDDNSCFFLFIPLQTVNYCLSVRTFDDVH